MDTLGKGMVHMPGGTDWDFIMLLRMPYKLLISGTFHFWTAADCKYMKPWKETEGWEGAANVY
jgi:hypothetical protein